MGTSEGNEWREYTIAGYYSDGRRIGAVDVFLAPNLDYAFACARRAWPFAKSWRCLGSKRAYEIEA